MVFGDVVGEAADLLIQAGGKDGALEVMPVGALSVWKGRLGCSLQIAALKSEHLFIGRVEQEKL